MSIRERKAIIMHRKKMLLVRKSSTILMLVLLIFVLTSCKLDSTSDHLPITVDFDDATTGNYRQSNILADWPNAKMLWGKLDRVKYKLGLVPSYIQIKEIDGNKVLRVNYPANVYGPLVGTQWRSNFSKVDEAVLSYRIYIPIDFDFAQGGKLPGLAGGTANVGGQVPNGYDGWSARLMFNQNAEVAYYLYYPDQSTEFGEYHYWAIDSVRVHLPLGQWVTLTHYVKMNTPKHRNGRLVAWIDEVKVVSVDSIRFRDTCSLAIDQILFSTFYGGDSPDWAPQNETYLLFDDFSVNLPVWNADIGW